ncbi:MAG: hypothetical protein VKN13_00960 [Cyanobacteriota bacterium]|nr:hypothetical protein [Cyanobacteriota bacterium]
MPSRLTGHVWRRWCCLLPLAPRFCLLPQPIRAAATPEPSVFQIAIDDFHGGDEPMAYVEEVNRYRETRSALLAAIQDRLATAGVGILSPAYDAIPDGNPSTVPAHHPS